MTPTVARLALVLSFAACGGRGAAPPAVGSTESPADPARPASSAQAPSEPPVGGTRLAAPPRDGQRVAVFAGGCFWCMEAPFERLDGVLRAVSGYTGGDVAHPTYEQVSTGATGHYEAVRVVYDPARVTYAALLDVFLHNVDPTDAHGQFCDHGPQYRAAVFVESPDERALAEAALARVPERIGVPARIGVLPAAPFYEAEAYHQDFYRTHESTYLSYRGSCGRDARLRELWGEGPGH